MERLCRYFMDGFAKALAQRDFEGRRIGAELKLPLVDARGAAAPREQVDALWAYLESRGWSPKRDALAGKVVGCTKPGEMNETVASCETGYCKTEFSLAHVGDLWALDQALRELKAELRPFSDQEGAFFLGYGIQPVTPPGQGLLMKQGRTAVWDRFRSNRHIAPADGDDMHLFTVNAASHVHISVGQDEAVDAVNLLNGLAGAQIALMADSAVWRGRVDPEYKSPAEMFWDWWIPEPGRVGVPSRPYADLDDYVHQVAEFEPVFVSREDQPLLLTRYGSFKDYFLSCPATGTDLEGAEREITPRPADLDLHSTCYWHNARLSRYFTVENRVNDQQPPDDLILPSAVTLGLVSALDEGREEIAAYDWADLVEARRAACASGVAGRAGAVDLENLAGRLLDLAARGLASRGRGEEAFLEPLRERLQRRTCPADQAVAVFREGGAAALVADRRI